MAGLLSRAIGPRPPATRMAAPLPRPAPVWPTVSIVVLLCFSAVLKPIVLTVMNATLVTLVALVALLANLAVDRRLVAVVAPFFVIGLVGLAGGLDADRYTALKDLWYVLNPALIVLTGYVLYLNKPDLERGLRAFVVGGLIVGLWQLRPYFLYPEIALLPATTIRRIVGTGFYAPVLALVILLLFVGQWRRGLRLPPWLAGAMFAVVAAAVAGVFSRTALVVVAVALAALAGGFARREWLRIGLPAIALVALASSLQLALDLGSEESLQTFSGKIVRGLEELSVNEAAGMREIHQNFRGYETARALDQYAAGGPLQLLFGRGFGALVDLGVYIPLGNSESGIVENVRFIPVLHNGYAYLLTKAGALAVVLYLVVLGLLYRLARPAAGGAWGVPETRVGRLLQAAVVTLAVTTWVIGGVFNKTDMFPFLLVAGFLLAHLCDAGRRRA